MNCEIKISDDKKYIILKYDGEINSKFAIQNNIKAHRLGKEHGIHNYLVDARNSINTDSVIKNYNFAFEDMPKTEDIDLKARVVMLVSEEDHSHDFVETVSINAGFNVKLFRNEQEALKHLLR
jgi:hypothetical protein